jgi:membrane-bound lytic murein transglycosylase D
MPKPELLADRLQCIESTIPMTYNKAVGGFIHFFTVRKRNYSQTMLERKNYYFPIFEEYLAKYGLPDELKYLSIVESGLNPRAVSRSGAVGLWQFMPGTGYDFRLQQNSYIDERMDPHKATDAACRYLRYLYSLFGDWHLALAAYNCGPGNVRKAQLRSGKYKFWDIYSHLPAETRSYVPQFVAATYTMNYAKEHNLFADADSTLNHIPHDTVWVEHFVHLDSLADYLDVPDQHLKQLNPSFRKYATPHNERHCLKLPTHKISDFISMKETLEAKAQLHWPTFKQKMFPSFSYDNSARKLFYTVGKKDNVAKIASRFGVKVSDIRLWNVLRGGKVRTGQMLVIWKKSNKHKSLFVKNVRFKNGKKRVYYSRRFYKVQPGDTLFNISQKHDGVSVSDIIRLNQLKGGAIKPGQKLIVG